MTANEIQIYKANMARPIPKTPAINIKINKNIQQKLSFNKLTIFPSLNSLNIKKPKIPKTIAAINLLLFISN